MSDTIRWILSAALISCGVGVMACAVLGVFRFRFVLNRMHCAGMIDTLGMLLLVAGLAVASGRLRDIAKLALILLLLWVSSPIASHLVSRMELSTDETASSHMRKEDRDVRP